MCGIAGFAGHLPDPETARAQLGQMCAAIRHRGPDGEGALVDGPVALGMRRLSIIDLEGGWQPIGNEDDSIKVIFNGEIYNFRALRAELEHLGHQFRTRSDTETILHGYEEWGDGVLHHLRGMFAIALWDRPRQRLLLARDRLGIKPLYLWELDGRLAFASELKSLQVLPGFPSEPDPSALFRYLAFGYVPDPLCIWRGVRKLPPGCLVTWEPGQATAERQWWTPLVREQSKIDEKEAIEELRRRLADAVECHLEADVSLGAFLSGGVDSSAVVAQMTTLATGRVKTFSIGFREEEFNEAPHAAMVAAGLGTDHTERILTPEIETLVDELVLAFDEPFADSSALPTWLVSQVAREQVTVALSGDGGDELFGGYTRYHDVRAGRATHRLLRSALGALGRLLPHGTMGKLYLMNLGRSPIGRYTSTVALPVLPEEGGVVRPHLVSEGARLEHLLGNLFELTAGRDLSSRMTLVDVLSYLPGNILTKLDRMSMKVSLEARVPLLDHEFAEFALSLPTRLKFRDGVGKWILREAIRPLVPSVVLKKPKHGFGVPIVHWVRGPLRPRIGQLVAGDSPIYAWCDHDAVRRIATEHLSGRRRHSSQLWRLLVLHTWMSAHQA